MDNSVDAKQLVEVMGDAVMVSDHNGLITFWNPAAERIFGFSAEDALGQSLDIIIPERLRERHWEGYYRSMASGETKYGNDLLRVPALHKDGSTISIAFTVALLRDESGALSGIAAVVRDETDRFQKEREMKKRVAELEKQVAGHNGSA